jgi:sensor histidine kinase regulating citrate/malate metabolism
MKFIKNAKQIKEDNNISTWYTSNSGKESTDNTNAAAKSVHISSGVKFYVLASKRQRRLYNPIVDKIDEKNQTRLENEFLFEEVNKECYDNYVSYLRDRNSYLLTKAQIYYKR